MARLVQRLGLTRYEADEHYKKALLILKDVEKKNSTATVDDAIIEITYAIDLLPTNAEYYAARGYFYLLDSMNREAQTDFEQALKVYAYEMLAHFGLGVLAYRERQWDVALAHFQDAYYAQMDRAETLYYLALTHHRKQQNAQALEWMTRAEALFEQANNAKQKRHATHWIKEFDKLAKKQLPEQT
jgi:tetratricopeptide (TPR) repeat protein